VRRGPCGTPGDEELKQTGGCALNGLVGWSGTAQNPRAKEFDVDYGGEAKAPCVESATTPGVFTRQYPKATLTW
jgi:hypothetical protein